MLALFAGVVVFGVTFYTEGLVPRYAFYDDGTQVGCGTALVPLNGATCDDPWASGLWAAAVALVLLATCVGGMLFLGIRRSRRVWR